MDFKTSIKELLIIFLTIAACILLMSVLGFISGCSKGSKATIGDLQALTLKAAKYHELLAENPEGVITARCDGLTFRSLGVYVNVDYPIYNHFYDNKWHRDYKPCFVVGDSRSEISRDGFIMLFHALLDLKDLESFKQIRDYGKAHNWIMGEGPTEYTSILLLTPILYEIINDLSLRITDAGQNSSDAILKLDTFRGNLLAMYIWLRARLNKEINAVEAQALRMLYDSNQENPLYSVLFYKFLGEGNQQRTIDLLLNQDDFPEGLLPGRVDRFNWSDAPGAILYLLTVKILKDR